MNEDSGVVVMIVRIVRGYTISDFTTHCNYLYIHVILLLIFYVCMY